VATPADHPIRHAAPADLDAVGRLLHDFNVEFDEPTPEPPVIAERLRRLMDEEGLVTLLGGSGPDGLAVLRFRPSIWTSGLECYLAELYVVPPRRGQGLGRALMETAMDLARERGADLMYLGTGEDDAAARSLYESLGFLNREKGPDGPLNFFYERKL
jgi:GNAT superfamily N-acetyltransferase